MNRKFRFRYDNIFVVVACAIIGFEVASMLGGVNLNSNTYKDILQIIVASPAILYCIMYLGKKIENTLVGKSLARIGRDSFYIMALHLAGMKVCTMALHASKMGGGMLSSLTPSVGNNIVLLIIYLISGIGIPLIFMFFFRKLRSLIL